MEELTYDKTVITFARGRLRYLIGNCTERQQANFNSLFEIEKMDRDSVDRAIAICLKAISDNKKEQKK